VRGNVGGPGSTVRMDESTGQGDSPPPPDGGGLSAGGSEVLEGDALAAAMLATFDGLVSSAQSAERIVSASMALRAAQIDQLRVWSDAMVAAESPAVSRGPHGWTPEVRGRRELVFELACALRIPESTADRLIDESRRLVHALPETHLALREGEISYRHAHVMVNQTATLPDEAAADYERELLPFAKSLTVAKFTRVARKKREVLHPESITERRQKGVDDRRVWFDPLPDGMAFIGAHLSAEIGVAAYGRLTEIARAQDAPDDDRTLAQKRADALGDLLLDGDTCAAEGSGAGAGGGSGSGAGTGHGIRPKVLVTVPMLTLLGKSQQPANLEGYGPIDPEVARQLAADAPSFTRVLTDPVTSAILDFDRTKYAVPADLRLVLRVRDEVCRAPGCNSLAVNCDVDHSVDFALGGTTCAGNLSHLCRAHHNLKHHTRVRLHNPGDGRIVWTTRAGRTYVTYPANTVGAPPGGSDQAGAPPPGDWPETDAMPEPPPF
jgi:hypothetical protein